MRGILPSCHRAPAAQKDRTIGFKADWFQDHGDASIVVEDNPAVDISELGAIARLDDRYALDHVEGTRRPEPANAAFDETVGIRFATATSL